MGVKLKYDRIWNFNAGPAAIPLEVLERVHENWFNFGGTGMNVMEWSHRSKEYDEIHNEAISRVKRLMGLGEDYHVLLLQGGASTQFAMLPMNFLAEGQTADYINTGAWSKKAIAEAKGFGNVNIAFNGEEVEFKRLPMQAELNLTPKARYVHITSNNTIKGTQFHTFPDVADVPLVADMSSDILSHEMDFSQFSMIYAGAQKNLGPSGVTLVILRDDFFQQEAADGVPTMLKYATHIEKNSLFNTAPTFGIYMLGEVLRWVEDHGGVAGMHKRNEEKAKLLYGFFNDNDDYFRCPVEEGSESWMNVCFRLPNEDLEAKMISESKAFGFSGMKGHRSVGGLRISMYNASPIEAVKDVIEFMTEFKTANPA
jgi:phosphoserine aminotransferase